MAVIFPDALDEAPRNAVRWIDDALCDAGIDTYYSTNRSAAEMIAKQISMRPLVCDHQLVIDTPSLAVCVACGAQFTILEGERL